MLCVLCVLCYAVLRACCACAKPEQAVCSYWLGALVRFLQMISRALGDDTSFHKLRALFEGGKVRRACGVCACVYCLSCACICACVGFRVVCACCVCMYVT